MNDDDNAIAAVMASYEKALHREETVLVAHTWAFVRTNLAGNTKINATGARVKEANQELFGFQKLENPWKISRYGFSTTNPSHVQG